MTVAFANEKGKLRAGLKGELDHHEASSVTGKILREIELMMPRDCVLDMGGVSFMDSSGIAVALKLYKKMNATGGRLFIENVGSQPMHVFDAAGLERIITISPSV